MSDFDLGDPVGGKDEERKEAMRKASTTEEALDVAKGLPVKEGVALAVGLGPEDVLPDQAAQALQVLASAGLSKEEAKAAADGVAALAIAAKVKEGSRLEPLPQNRPAPPLEQYVAEAREGARLVGVQKQEKLPEPQNQKELNERRQDLADRVDRAEKYARWRWQGYQDGEVASL